MLKQKRQALGEPGKAMERRLLKMEYSTGTVTEYHAQQGTRTVQSDTLPV
jgi:hypothetical protein